VEQFAELIKKEDIEQLSQSEGLSFDDDRLSILESVQSIDVQACPGSGKTTLIAAKLMLLAKKWPLSGQGICVLSHTNVAKDEIIERLKRSKTPEAQRLLSYPHFIGTIQEFTNRFLALPSIHSRGIDEVIVDNDEYATLASKILSSNQFSWLSGTLNGLGGDDMKTAFLRETYLLPSGEVNISKQPRAWSQQPNLDKAKQSLKTLKNYLDERGYYLYRDMYSQAQKICGENDKLCKALSKRFPFVFIDEMQDTQKFQDELLQRIFPLDDTSVTVQRFGDPDQAIFHGIGKEESNESFNGKQAGGMDFVVNKSHRFDENLASKIKSLSVNQITLSSELSGEALNDRLNACSQEEGFQHSILVFNDDTIGSVVQSFTDIISEQFQNEYKASERFTVKIVGAVGNEMDTRKNGLA
jgi:DNA helicase-2/ATP-dependent DNA helicase PcrA